MTKEQAEVCKQMAALADQLIALTGMAAAALQAMVQVKQHMSSMAKPVPAKDDRAILERELAAARAERDKAEAIIARQQQELADLRGQAAGSPKGKSMTDTVRAAVRKGKRRAA